MKRPSVNITPLERVGRVLIGLVGAVGGVVLLVSSSGAVASIFAVLIGVAGLDLLVTGAVGHCPLYRRLGYVPPSLRSPV